MPRLSKRAVRFSVTHHFLAIRIERVVNNPLCCIQCVVILESEMPKAFSDGNESWTLGLVIERIVRVGAIDDLPKQHERRIAGKLVFLQDRLERALLAVVPEFHVRDVVGPGDERRRADADGVVNDEQLDTILNNAVVLKLLMTAASGMDWVG